MAWRAHASEVHGPLTCLLAQLRCLSALQRRVCAGNSSLGNARLPILTKPVRYKLRDSVESKPQGQEGWQRWGGAAAQRAAANAVCLAHVRRLL